METFTKKTTKRVSVHKLVMKHNKNEITSRIYAASMHMECTYIHALRTKVSSTGL